MHLSKNHIPWVLVALVILITFCTRSQKPKNLIPEDTYIELIVELQVAEATLETVNDTLDRRQMLQRIFADHHVNYQQFIKSHRYYSKNIKQQQQRLSKALELLQERRRTPGDSIQTIPKTRRSSGNRKGDK